MATITSAQSKLVLNAFAAIFQNNLLAADLVTWKQYDGEMNDRNALTVVEQIPPRYVVNQTVNGVSDLTSGVQDTVFGSEQFTVNRTFNANMGWGDFVKITTVGDARESEALKSAATQLAEQIDAYILRVATLASNNWVGTAGNNVSLYNDFASAYTRLKKEGVDDSDLRGVLTYDDKQALGADVITRAPLEAVANPVYRQGFSGEVAGLPTMFTQQLPTYTAGTRTNGTISGANQNVNYSAVATSGAPGQYMTQTLNLAGLGAAATIKAGDVFQIANVFAYDNRLQATHSHLQQFTVIADATADGAGAATVRIFPAIIVPATGSSGDVNVNTAHATVGTIPANSAVVTFLVSASAAVKPRVILQKQAIICNTVDLIMPATGQAERKQLTKVPLSVRMWRDSLFATGDHRIRFDVALTANVRDRRRIIRLNGA